MKYLLVILLGQLQALVIAQGYDQLSILGKATKPIVTATLNGKEAYFLLDTGSDITILNANEQDNYGFNTFKKHHANRRVASLGSTMQDLRNTFNVKLMLGNQKIVQHVYAYDLSNIVKSIAAKFRVDIVGIIGSDVMRKYNFKIDYQYGVVMIPHKKKSTPMNPPGDITAVNSSDF